jgi:hypothetical protein
MVGEKMPCLRRSRAIGEQGEGFGQSAPGLLSIERFALNRGWPPYASKVMVDLMRRAGFPACATSEELADTPNPVRLPECSG